MYSRDACRSFLLCLAAVALASVAAQPDLAAAPVSAESEPRENTADRNRVLVKIYSKGGSKDDVADAVKELVVGALSSITEAEVSSEVIEKHSTGIYRRMGAFGASACPEDASSFYTVIAFDVSTSESSSELEKYLWSTDIAAAINSAKPDLCTAKVIPAKRGAKFTVLRAVAPKGEGSRGRRESKYSGPRFGSSTQAEGAEGHHSHHGHIGLNRTHAGSLSSIKSAAAGEGHHASGHHHSQAHEHGQDGSKGELSDEANPHPSNGHHSSDNAGSRHPGGRQGKAHGTKRPVAHDAEGSFVEVVEKDGTDEDEVAATMNLDKQETVDGEEGDAEKAADAEDRTAGDEAADAEEEQVHAEEGNAAELEGQEDAGTVTNTADDEASAPADEQAQEEAADEATAPEEAAEEDMAGEPEEEGMAEDKTEGVEEEKEEAADEPEEEDMAEEKPEDEEEGKEEEGAEEPGAEEEKEEEEVVAEEVAEETGVEEEKEEEEVVAEEVAEEIGAEEEVAEETDVEDEEEVAEETDVEEEKEEEVVVAEELKQEMEPVEEVQEEEEGADVAEANDEGEDDAPADGLQREAAQEEAVAEAARH